jgi:hypothetical protein
MASENKESIEKQLNMLIELMQTLVALELSKCGVPQREIGKRLHLRTTRIAAMVKGVTKQE